LLLACDIQASTASTSPVPVGNRQPKTLLEWSLKYWQNQFFIGKISLLELRQCLPEELMRAVVGPVYLDRLLNLIAEGDPFIVGELLNDGADVNPVLQKITDSPLFHATTQANINAEMVRLLIEKGSPIVITTPTKKIPWQMQPIFKLMQANNKELVSFLLSMLTLDQLNDIKERRRTFLDVVLESDIHGYRLPEVEYYTKLLRDIGAKTKKELEAEKALLNGRD